MKRLFYFLLFCLFSIPLFVQGAQELKKEQYFEENSFFCWSTRRSWLQENLISSKSNNALECNSFLAACIEKEADEIIREFLDVFKRMSFKKAMDFVSRKIDINGIFHNAVDLYLARLKSVDSVENNALWSNKVIQFFSLFGLKASREKNLSSGDVVFEGTFLNDVDSIKTYNQLREYLEKLGRDGIASASLLGEKSQFLSYLFIDREGNTFLHDAALQLARHKDFNQKRMDKELRIILNKEIFTLDNTIYKVSFFKEFLNQNDLTYESLLEEKIQEIDDHEVLKENSLYEEQQKSGTPTYDRNLFDEECQEIYMSKKEQEALGRLWAIIEDSVTGRRDKNLEKSKRVFEKLLNSLDEKEVALFGRDVNKRFTVHIKSFDMIRMGEGGLEKRLIPASPRLSIIMMTLLFAQREEFEWLLSLRNREGKVLFFVLNQDRYFLENIINRKLISIVDKNERQKRFEIVCKNRDEQSQNVIKEMDVYFKKQTLPQVDSVEEWKAALTDPRSIDNRLKKIREEKKVVAERKKAKAKREEEEAKREEEEARNRVVQNILKAKEQEKKEQEDRLTTVYREDFSCWRKEPGLFWSSLKLSKARNVRINYFQAACLQGKSVDILNQIVTNNIDYLNEINNDIDVKLPQNGLDLYLALLKKRDADSEGFLFDQDPVIKLSALIGLTAACAGDEKFKHLFDVESSTFNLLRRNIHERYYENRLDDVVRLLYIDDDGKTELHRYVDQIVDDETISFDRMRKAFKDKKESFLNTLKNENILGVALDKVKLSLFFEIYKDQQGLTADEYFYNILDKGLLVGQALQDRKDLDAQDPKMFYTFDTQVIIQDNRLSFNQKKVMALFFSLIEDSLLGRVGIIEVKKKNLVLLLNHEKTKNKSLYFMNEEYPIALQQGNVDLSCAMLALLCMQDFDFQWLMDNNIVQITDQQRETMQTIVQDERFSFPVSHDQIQGRLVTVADRQKRKTERDDEQYVQERNVQFERELQMRSREDSDVSKESKEIEQAKQKEEVIVSQEEASEKMQMSPGQHTRKNFKKKMKRKEELKKLEEKKD